MTKLFIRCSRKTLISDSKKNMYGKALTTSLFLVIHILLSSILPAQAGTRTGAVTEASTDSSPPITYADSYTPISLEMKREMVNGARSSLRNSSGITTREQARAAYRNLDRLPDFPEVYREGIKEMLVTWLDEERILSKIEAETIIRDVLTEAPDTLWNHQIDSVNFWGTGTPLIAIDTKEGDGAVGRLIISYKWPYVSSVYSDARGRYWFSIRKHEEVFRLSTYQLEYIIPRISVGDSGFRQRMIHRLADVGRNEPEAGLALIPLLNESDPGVLNIVLFALTRVKAPQDKILDALLEKIDSVDDSDRHLFISPLGAFSKQSNRLSPVLMRLLNDPEPATRYSAISSLREMDRHANSIRYNEIVDGLIEAYDTGDTQFRSAVIHTLAGYVTTRHPVPTDKIKATLERALSDPDEEIRKRAANRLRHIEMYK